MEPQIISLDISRKEEAANVLAAAFSAYPLMHYIYGVSNVPITDSLQAMFRVSFEARLTFGWPRLGILDENGKLVGAALMNLERGLDWPNVLQEKHNEFKQIVGPESAARLQAFNKLADTGRPEEPHYGLGVIGVLPEMQGQGCGGRLLDEIGRMSEADPNSSGVWLDTETEHNVAYYQKFGFQVMAHNVLDSSVDIWGMFRPDKQ